MYAFAYIDLGQVTRLEPAQDGQWTYSEDGRMKRLVLVLMLLWPMGAVADFAAGLEAAQHGDYATSGQQRLEPTFGTGGK